MLTGEWVTIVMNQPGNDRNAIRGVVQGEAGQSLEGILVQVHPEGDRKAVQFARTNKNGVFVAPVGRGRRYHLSIPPRPRVGRSALKDKRWYVAEGVPGTPAGAQVVLTARSWTRCIACSLSAVAERYGAPFEYRVWLESEDGAKVGSSKVIRSRAAVYFMGIPAGRLRAVIETSRGERLVTSFHTVEHGQGGWLHFKVD